MNLRQTLDHTCVEFKTTLGGVVNTTGDVLTNIASSYQRRLLSRGVQLMEKEINQAAGERVAQIWDRNGVNGSKISQAKSPSLWLDRVSFSQHFEEKSERYPNTESVFLDKPKQQTLKTTSAAWPISKASQAECLRK